MALLNHQLIYVRQDLCKQNDFKPTNFNRLAQHKSFLCECTEFAYGICCNKKKKVGTTRYHGNRVSEEKHLKKK